jgi:hypothetical protein
MQALCNQGRAQGPRPWSLMTVLGMLCMDCCRPRRALRGYGAYVRGCIRALRQYGKLGGTRRCSVDSGSCPPQKRASIASVRGEDAPKCEVSGLLWSKNSPVGGCAALRAVHSRCMPDPVCSGFFPCQRITDALSFSNAMPISSWAFVACTLFHNT